MAKNYSSLNSNTTLEFNKKSARKISSGIDFKTMKASWFFMIMLLLGMTITNRASANNTTNFVCDTTYTYPTVILNFLISSVAEGRGGGGGHGNYDWVKGVPKDACPEEFIIRNFNKNYNSIII